MAAFVASSNDARNLARAGGSRFSDANVPSIMADRLNRPRGLIEHPQGLREVCVEFL